MLTEGGYDAAGNRVRKVQVNSAGSAANERVYLGGVEVYRQRAVASGVLGAVNSERETLHIADDAGRIVMVETLTIDGGTVVSSPANVARYQYGNHLGTVALELDDSAAIISYEEFHPYGTSAYRAVDSAIGVSAKRYRYVGLERDEETGLDQMGARYYAPWLGRWTAADPIGLGGGINLYEYAAGNPVRLADPRGMAPESTTSTEESAGNLRQHSQRRPTEPPPGAGPGGWVESPYVTVVSPREEGLRAWDWRARPESTRVGGATEEAPDVVRSPRGTKDPSSAVENEPKETEKTPRPERPAIWGFLPFTSLEDAIYDFRDAIDAFARGDTVGGTTAIGWGLVNTAFFGLDLGTSGLGSIAKGGLRGLLKAGTRKSAVYARGAKGTVRLGRDADAAQRGGFSRAEILDEFRSGHVVVEGGVQSRRGREVLSGEPAPEHHIQTNKNYVSTDRGGPWSPRFEDLARRAGRSLEDAANRVRIEGHQGPHPEAYHRAVLNRLLTATDGLKGNALTEAYDAELAAIKAEAATPGTALNNLLVR